MSVEAKRWVRLVDGRLVLTWIESLDPIDGVRHRPLTLLERVWWRLTARPPQP